MINRLYHLLALMALVNLFAIVGLVGYLFSSGKLNAERVDQIAKVMRGEISTSQPATSQPTTAPAAPEPSRAEIERLKAQREYYDLVSERHQRELEDRERLNQRILFEVNSKLEEIQREKDRIAQERKQATGQSDQGGFIQMVEMISGMDAAKARDLLRKQKDADAAAILSKMDSNRSKKVINSCKTQEELLWIGRILNQIKQSGDPGAGVDGPKPASTGE